MKKIISSWVLFTFLGLLSCANDQNDQGDQQNNTPHPGANFFGTWQLDCICDDNVTSETESYPFSYQLVIEQIPGDSQSVYVRNIHNHGQTFPIAISNPYTLTGGYTFMGSVYEDAMGVSYWYWESPIYYDCAGSALKL